MKQDDANKFGEGEDGNIEINSEELNMEEYWSLDKDIILTQEQAERLISGKLVIVTNGYRVTIKI